MEFEVYLEYDMWGSMMTQVVQLTKFDYRLANKLETDLQKLRCRVNYHALKFADPIIEMGRKLINRMREKSKHFIALHLRQVMFVYLSDVDKFKTFSCCLLDNLLIFFGVTQSN